MMAGSYVPDPFLDPKSGLLGIKPAEYASPYGRVHIPVEAPARTKTGEVSTHPMAVLFPGTAVGQFARYLGAPTGMDSGAVEAFVRRRLDHATSIHSHLHQLNDRSAYQLLRYVAVPRMTFLPSVMYPSLLSDYVDPFDTATDAQWRRITGLSAADPRYPTLLARRTLPTSKGGSGIRRRWPRTRWWHLSRLWPRCWPSKIWGHTNIF